MQILGFGASSSSTSINKKFVTYVINQLKDKNIIEILDLNDYVLPLFSVDLEEKDGFPKNVNLFMEKLHQADLILISFAEHNGSYAAVFKNLLDWCSRVKGKFLENKKLVLFASSPGARGGKGVLSHAMERLPRHGAEILGSFSLPNFEQTFSQEKGILDENLKSDFENLIKEIKEKIG